MTRTSVIIPLYNGERWISACLAALRAEEPDEIIVVDDASPDRAAAWVEAHAPAVRLLRLPTNGGFAAACNHGLRAATGDVLVLLNQDTEVEPGWLAPLIERLADPTIAFVGSRAAYPDGRLQHAGGWVDVRGEAGHYHEEREAGEVTYVSGASLATRRDIIEQIGALDESFVPAYFEDVEWCLRARARGLHVWYEPASRLIHYEESQLAAPTEEGMIRFHRNRLRLVLKRWSTGAIAERFLPAERAWLESLGQGGEVLVGVMHRLYLHFLVRLERYSASPEGAEARAAALIGLLAVLPARPTELSFRFEPEHLSSDAFPPRERPSVPDVLPPERHPASTLPPPRERPTVPVLPPRRERRSAPVTPREWLDRLQRAVTGGPLPPGLARGSGRWIIAQLRRLVSRLRTNYPGSNTLHALTIAALEEQRTALIQLAEHLAEHEAILEQRFSAHEQHLDAHEQRFGAHEQRFGAHEQRFAYHEQRLNHAYDARQRLVEVLLTYLQATNRNVGALGHQLRKKSAGAPSDGND